MLYLAAKPNTTSHAEAILGLVVVARTKSPYICPLDYANTTGPKLCWLGGRFETPAMHGTSSEIKEATVHVSRQAVKVKHGSNGKARNRHQECKGSSRRIRAQDHTAAPSGITIVDDVIDLTLAPKRYPRMTAWDLRRCLGGLVTACLTAIRSGKSTGGAAFDIPRSRQRRPTNRCGGGPPPDKQS